MFRQLRSLSVIITLAILSILGIGSVQFFWFKKAFDNREKIFNQNVALSLQNVGEYILNYNQINAPHANLVEQISSNYFVVHTNADIDIKILEHLIRSEFEKRNVYLDFEYAVYDCYDNKLVYGNYINMSNSFVGEGLGGENIRSFPPINNDNKYFGVLFPTRVTSILNEMGIWIFSTLVLLFVFAFFATSIYILFRQKKLSDMQKDFINNMTHEFKTPLYTIMVSAELIKKPDILKNEAFSREYLDIITQEANRLKTQIERILRIASSDKDKFQLEKETFDIHETIQKAAEVAQALISDSKGIIQFKLDAKQHAFYGDKMHMENVIYNLIENAIKYTDKVPEIMIRTYNTSGYLFVEVKDNGIGINTDQRKRIFDKFYRVPTGNTHNVKGFGLGLSYVLEIVKAHKGRIKVESEPGEGSTFNIKLPMMQGPK
jgi:two-component system, OmpR family, phosphate regulon sensor histidine kinase PhoR